MHLVDAIPDPDAIRLYELRLCVQAAQQERDVALPLIAQLHTHIALLQGDDHVNHVGIIPREELQLRVLRLQISASPLSRNLTLRGDGIGIPQPNN